MPPLPEATAQRLSGQLRILGDSARIRLLVLLAAAPQEGARSGELVAASHLSQAVISHHLKALGEAGLIVVRREGSHLYYRLPSRSRRLLGILERLLAGQAGSLEAGQQLRRTLDEIEEEARDRSSTASTRPVPHLLDPEHVIERVQERLVTRFSGIFSLATVRRCLQDSYELLARSTTRTADLPALTEQFAADRLSSTARSKGVLLKATPEVLFVCVHNAGRSQMAVGLLRRLAGDRVSIHSAGSAPVGGVSPGVRAAMAEIGISLASEYPKPLTDEIVHAADFVITMGCGDACPVYPGKVYLDWEIEAPSRRAPSVVRTIRDDIEQRIRAELLPRLLAWPGGAGPGGGFGR